jgi:hypothetical protein
VDHLVLLGAIDGDVVPHGGVGQKQGKTPQDTRDKRLAHSIGEHGTISFNEN